MCIYVSNDQPCHQPKHQIRSASYLIVQVFAGKKVLRRPRSALARMSSVGDPSLPAATGRLTRPRSGQQPQQQVEHSQLAAAEQLAKLSQARADPTAVAAQSTCDALCSSSAAGAATAPPCSVAVQSMPLAEICMPARSGAEPMPQAAAHGPQTAATPIQLLAPPQHSTSATGPCTGAVYGAVKGLLNGRLPASHSASATETVDKAAHASAYAPAPASVSSAALGLTSGPLAGLPICLAPSSLIRPAATPGLRQSMWQHLHSLPPGTVPPLQSPFAAIATVPFSFQAPLQSLPLSSQPCTHARPSLHAQPGAAQPSHLRGTQPQTRCNYPSAAAPASASLSQHPAGPHALQSWSQPLHRLAAAQAGTSPATAALAAAQRNVGQPQILQQQQQPTSQTQAQLRNTAAQTSSRPSLVGAADALTASAVSPFCAASQATSVAQSQPQQAQPLLQAPWSGGTAPSSGTVCARPMLSTASAELPAALTLAGTAARTAGTAYSQPGSACSATTPALGAFSYTRPHSATLPPARPHSASEPAKASAVPMPEIAAPQAAEAAQARQVTVRGNCGIDNAAVPSTSAFLGCSQPFKASESTDGSSHSADACRYRDFQSGSKSTSAVRLPLSPSVMRCNGEAIATLLQPWSSYGTGSSS